LIKFKEVRTIWFIRKWFPNKSRPVSPNSTLLLVNNKLGIPSKFFVLHSLGFVHLFIDLLIYDVIMGFSVNSPTSSTTKALKQYE